MRVGPARVAAARWVMRHACREAGFQGAYFSGSTVGLPDDAELPAASDVDVVVITPAARPIAIDGSRELIEAGAHREAVFWIVATFAR